MKQSNKVFRLTLIHALLILGSAAAVFPLAWTILTSFKQPSDTFAYPPVVFSKGGPTLINYLSIIGSGEVTSGMHLTGIKTNIILYVKNSLTVASLSTLLALIGAFLSAYSLSRFEFKGRKIIAFLILLTRMLPPIALTIPLFVLANKFGLLDRIMVLILPYTALNLPLSIWMLKGFMDDIPVAIEEAARIDGCTRLRCILTVILPLVAPGLVATAIFCFILAWNEFALALVLTVKSSVTIPLLTMVFVAEEGIYWGPMAAAGVLASIPPLLFVLIAQRYMIKGLTLGALKG